MTEKLSITIEQAREHMVAAIEEKGADYIYPGSQIDSGDSCFYGDYRNGKPGEFDFFEDADCQGPSCIVGHVLVKAGVRQADLFPLEGVAATNVIATLTGVGTIDDDTPVARALQAAQSAQDQGETWGQALAEFDRIVESFKDDLAFAEGVSL